MIYDKLSHSSAYTNPVLSAAFARAFEFIRKIEQQLPEAGRYPIVNTEIFAHISHPSQVGRSRARLEAHRKYIDIHYIVKGCELIGHQTVSDQLRPADRYNPHKDIQFFLDRPAIWHVLHAGDFAIFFPQDAHAPLAGRGPLSKIVIKIAIPSA